MSKVIFLGFDGANPEMVEKYIDKLPNFKRLINTGSWGPMLSTFPVDSPTNWTALATGATAAVSGITGFHLHKPGTSLRHVFSPIKDYAKFREAEFIWEAAARQGKKSILINYPFSWYSLDSSNLVIIGGDAFTGGIPQIMDCGCFCTPDRINTIDDGKLVEVDECANGYRGRMNFNQEYIMKLEIPEAKKAENNNSELVLLFETHGSQLVIKDINNDEKTRLRKGEWSNYFSIPYKGGKAWLRVFLSDINDKGNSFQLFHTMLSKSEGWTKPYDLARKMLDKVGPYQQGIESQGTAYIKNWFGEYGIEAYCELLRFGGDTLVKYARELAIEMPDYDQIFIQLNPIDGLNHKRLCHLDPESPLSNLEKAVEANQWFFEAYKTMDWILGQVANFAEEQGAVLVAVSDHSAIPTHTWVDTARPLIQEGIIVFNEDGEWDESRSKAKKMINHSIYINLKDREPTGVVDSDQYEKLRDEIISILMNMKDPRTNECPIALAARREEMDSIGANGANFGDIIYLMRPGYTNQPASEAKLLTIKELSEFVVDPNESLRTGYGLHKNILGNHHDYLPDAYYNGVSSNRAILLIRGPGIQEGYRISSARTIDIASTIARILDIDPPAQNQGHELYGIFK
jgi:predicted AlkP superfamily phosphohydrolase/phosphomutase